MTCDVELTPAAEDDLDRLDTIVADRVIRKCLAARARVPLPRALLGMAVHQLYHSRNVAAIVL